MSTHNICFHGYSWPRGYKTFFMLNSAEHEIAEKFSCSATCSKTEFAIFMPRHQKSGGVLCYTL